MKDEITRIMKLVKEGKISPEDAAELIDAFSEAPQGEPEPEPEPVMAGDVPREEAAAHGEEAAPKAGKAENPFSSFIGAIEGIAKEVSTKVDWKDIAQQVSQGVDKGVDAIRKAAEDAKVGKGFRLIFGNHESKTVEMPLSVPDGKTLRIEAYNGDISVVGSDEPGRFRVEAEFRAASEEDAKKKASLYTPVIEESENHIILRLQEGPDSEVDTTININPAASLDIRTSSGRVSVRGMNGAVRIAAASADIEGSGLEGAVDVSLASGDVNLGSIDSPLVTVDTKSGDIGISESKGSLNIRSSSGDITLDRVSGRSISVESASGDVTIDIDRPVTGSVNIRAVSGDVSVEVPDGSDARISLSAVQGDACCGLEIQDKVESSGKITGRLGSGEGTIDLSTVSGDVSLSMRDNPTTEDQGEAAPEAPHEEPPASDSPSFH